MPNLPAVAKAMLSGVLAAVVLSGCAARSSSTALGSCTLGLAADVGDEDAIAAVLRAEGELSAAQRSDDLLALWEDGGSITDAAHTPSDNGDDRNWLGKEAIRQWHESTGVPPTGTAADAPDLQIAFTGGDRAIVTAPTYIEGAAVPARWILVRREGCWLLRNLTYHLEPL